MKSDDQPRKARISRGQYQSGDTRARARMESLREAPNVISANAASRAIGSSERRTAMIVAIRQKLTRYRASRTIL